MLGDQGAASERYEEENMGRGSETPHLEHPDAMGECAYPYLWGGGVCGPLHGTVLTLFSSEIRCFWLWEAQVGTNPA